MSSRKFPQLAPTIFVTALAASVANSDPADEVRNPQTIAAVQLSNEPAPPLVKCGQEDRRIG